MTTFVKITGSDSGLSWYKAAIGHVYEVTEYNEDCYRRADAPNYFIRKCDCEVVNPEPKLFSHEGKEYVVPEWVKYVTCDAKGERLIGWGRKPIYFGKVSGYQGTGPVAPLEVYVKLPEGAFIKEV